MNQGAVFVKTPKGLEEIQKPASHLSFALRSALILVDGKSSVEDLVKRFNRIGDIGPALEALLAQGFIAALSVPSAHAASAPAKKAEKSLDAVKSELANLIKEYVGLMGGPLLKQLDDCTSMQALCAHAAHCRALIGESFNEKKAQAFGEALKEIIP